MADPTNLNEDTELVPGLKYAKSREVTLPAVVVGGSKSPVDLENLNPDLKERIDYAARDWLANKELNPKGEAFPITSGRRTREQQYNEYKARLSGAKNTGFMAVNPDEYPGKQFFHENAVDLLPHVPDSFLANYGLHRPYGSKDPVHVEINPKAPWAKPDTDLTDASGVDVPGASYTQRQGTYTPTAKEAISSEFENIKSNLTSGDYYTKTLPKQAAALADVVYGVLPSAVSFVGHPFAALVDKFGGEGKAQEYLNKVTQFAGQPFGKAFGITNDPAYNAEGANRIMNFVGENVGKGADWVAKETGMPKADAEWLINAALIKATPTAVKGAQKGYELGKEGLGKAGEELKGQYENVKAKVGEKFPSLVPEENPNLRSVGAAEVPKVNQRINNARSLLEPIDLPRDIATRDFADIQFAREKAKEPEVGAPLRANYAKINEQVIRNFDKEIEATGADLTGIERGELGQRLNDVVADYKKARKQKVDEAYKAADTAGETLQQVPYKSILEYIADKRPTVVEQNPILKQVKEELAHNDPSGTGTISLRQMEDIRQLIGQEAEPGTPNGFHGKNIIREIDKTTHGQGGQLYQDARALHHQYMKEFEETPSVRNITSFKKGTTERSVPLENLAEKLMLAGPRSHVLEVFKTLENAGPEGQAMINELRGVVAEQIKNEATKSTRLDVNGNPVVSPAKLDVIIKKLDKSGKLDLLFGKQGAERYRTLNDLSKDIYTVPEGAVNTSNTTSSFKNWAADFAASYALSGVPAPIGHLAMMGKKEITKRRDLNRVSDFINFGKEQK